MFQNHISETEWKEAEERGSVAENPRKGQKEAKTELRETKNRNARGQRGWD